MDTLSSSSTQSRLTWFVRGILTLGFLILAARLFELTVIRGGYYRTLSDENRVRRVPIMAPRGRILARGGEILADNVKIKKRIIFSPDSGFEKVDLAEDIRDAEVISEWERKYSLGQGAAHITGYLGEVGESEVGKVDSQCTEKGPRNLGDQVGRGGLEEQYNCILAGIDGEELVEVDSLGSPIRTLGRKIPVAGEDIKTTIDYLLQEKVSGLLDGKKGAVVISDSGGEILALYSSPSYDPNIFIKSSDYGKITQVLNDMNQPLYNRAIGGIYHPGSVFKPIVAVASLEEGSIDENFTYEDVGIIRIQTPYGDFSYTNWYYNQYGGKEGQIGLTRAIARSTDTFFYTIGELTGVNNIKKWASVFFLDKETGIDLPGEITGIVPDPEWKIRVKGERWFLGNTYHLSIGQGDIALTPIGINMAIAAIAEDGEYCSPHILDKELVSRNFQFPVSSFQCRNLGIKKQNSDLVKEGMREACSSGGTGYTFFDFKEKVGYEVGCKTGTAEDERGEPHAWFSVFAPLTDPAIVATVLVEHGGEGSKVAGPIAREILDYWFDKKIKN